MSGHAIIEIFSQRIFTISVRVSETPSNGKTAHPTMSPARSFHSSLKSLCRNRSTPNVKSTIGVLRVPVCVFYL
jgi:hypothetical protein